MTTLFAATANNVSTKLAQAYSPGSGFLHVTAGDGALFPSPGSTFLRVTVVKAGKAYSPKLTSDQYTIFKVTAVVGDALTISGTLDGTTDTNSFGLLDVVEMRVTAGTLSDLHTSVNTLENAGFITGTTAQASALAPIATGSTTSRSLASRLAEFYHVRDYGAKGDGTTDDTAAIQACMNAAASTSAFGVVVFDRTPAYYRITSTLLVKTSVMGNAYPVIKMDGPTNGTGAHQIFQLKWQNMYAWTSNSVTYVQDFFIQGLVMDAQWDGNYSTFVYNVNEYDHGIAIQGVSNITIRDCRISNVVGDCINIGRTSVNSIANTPIRVLVEDCQLINPWRNGLQTGFNIDLTIRRCHVEKPGIYNFGFDIESDNNYADGTDPNTGVNVGDTTGIVIEDCYFMGTGINGTTGYPVPANAPFLQIANHNSTADIINVRVSGNTILTSTRAIGVTGAVYNVPPVTLRGFVTNLAIERNIFAGKQSSNPTTWTSPAGPLPDDYSGYIKYTRGCFSFSDNMDYNDSLYGWLFMGLSTGGRICGNTFAPQTNRRQIGVALDSGSSGDGGVANYNGPVVMTGNRFYGINSQVIAAPPNVSPATTPSVAAAIWVTGNNSAVAENHTITGNAIVNSLFGIVLDAPTVNKILIESNYIDASACQVYKNVTSTSVLVGGSNVMHGSGGNYNTLGPASVCSGNPVNMMTAGGTDRAYSDFEGATGIGWAAGANTVVSRSTLYAAHGTNSMEIKSTAAGTSVLAANSATIPNAQPGVPYYASIMIRAAANGTPRLVNLRINAYDINNTPLTWNGNLRNLPLDSTTGWTCMQLCAISPANTAKLFLSINIGTTGSFAALNECHYVDMVMLSPSGLGLAGALSNTVPWCLPGGSPQIHISGTNIAQLGTIANQELNLGSLGTAPIQLNFTPGLSGSGGTTFGDGAGNVVASVSSAGTATFNGGLVAARTTTATAYAIKTTDWLVAVTDTTAPRTVTLPDVTTVPAGKLYTIVDESGGAAAQNITVATTSAQTISGAATATINTNYGVLRIYGTGASWITI